MIENSFLVVVDDLFFSSKIGETIRHLGGTPVFAAETNEIPEGVSKHSLAAIIVDLDLSRTDAVQVISHLRTVKNTKGIPMMAYGQHTRPESFELARKAGCDQAIPRSEFVKRLPKFIQTCMETVGTRR